MMDIKILQIILIFANLIGINSFASQENILIINLKANCAYCNSKEAQSSISQLIEKNVINKSNVKSASIFLNNFEQSGISALDSYGNDILQIYKEQGIINIQNTFRFGSDYLKFIKIEDYKVIDEILTYPKAFTILKENFALVDGYKKYGPDIIGCMDKNPFCLNIMESTGLPLRSVMLFDHNNASWIQIKFKHLNDRDLQIARDLIQSNGNIALTFIRENWNIFLEPGVFEAYQRNFNSIKFDSSLLVKELEKNTVKPNIKRTVDSHHILLLAMALIIVFLGLKNMGLNRKLEQTK